MSVCIGSCLVSTGCSGELPGIPKVATCNCWPGGIAGVFTTATPTFVEQTDCEQIRSRINNNDCRTFRPRRPLSTAYKIVLYAVDKGLLYVVIETVHIFSKVFPGRPQSAFDHFVSNCHCTWVWLTIQKCKNFCVSEF